jgi:transposase
LLCFPIAHVPSVIQWLKRYPTITIVARDRSKEFAAAITAALPHAQHVVDRWHVAKNLTEHLDKVVSRRLETTDQSGGRDANRTSSRVPADASTPPACW